MDANDTAFLKAVESGTLPNSAFHHRDHIRLAWLYLRRDGPEAGARKTAESIVHFATAHGAADRFHASVTTFWVRLVQHVIDAFPTIDRFDEVLCAVPVLTDKTAVYRHYTRELLDTPAAKHAWVPPDLRPLP